jgi:transposase InsO family protein
MRSLAAALSNKRSALCHTRIIWAIMRTAPYKIHTVLTDNGIQFTKREGKEAYWTIPFDRLCDALGIEHRLTKINHPWTNGQVERMNRTIKEATVKR